MDKRRSSSNEASTSSDSTKNPSPFKKFIKRIFGSREKGSSDVYEPVIRVQSNPRPKTTRPNRQIMYRPTDHHYYTNHNSRGKVYIFSHLNFKNGIDYREGGTQDVKNLERALPKLGFKPEEIQVFHDLTFRNLEEKLEEISKEDFSQSDMLVVFVLTHGDRDGKICAYDKDYCVQEIWEHFTADKCETLAGKPKIFFIVACRGRNIDSGAYVRQARKLSVTECDSVGIQTTISYRIPIWADFLIVFSTMEGYYSYRNPTDGTWYIQALCQELKNFSEPRMHFLDFITRVNRNVAIYYETLFEDKKMDKKKQCPIVTSSLTKVININIEKNELKSNENKKIIQRPKSSNT